MGAGASAAAAPPADAEGGAEPAEAPAEAASEAASSEPGASILDELAKETDAAKHRQLIIDFGMIEESDKMMPSEDWYVKNLDDMKTKIDDVIAVFPDGLEKPWKGREDMILIMEKLEVAELLEHLVEQEVVGATTEVEAEAAEYEAKDLFETFETYEGFDSDEDVKGKVGLLIITILLLVDKKRGASVKKSVGN